VRSRSLEDSDLARLAGASQRAGYIARVYDGFVGIVEYARGPECVGSGAGPNSEGLLRCAAFEQILPFGLRAGEFDRAAAAVVDAHLGFALELLNECGILGEAFEGKAGQRSLGGEFAAWGQHARAGPTGFSAEFTRVEQRDG